MNLTTRIYTEQVPNFLSNLSFNILKLIQRNNKVNNFIFVLFTYLSATEIKFVCQKVSQIKLCSHF